MAEHGVPFFKSFIRAQFMSIAATSADFITLIGLEEFNVIQKIFEFSPEKSLLISTGLASFVGAIVGFLLGRHWAFKRTDRNFYFQALKYLLASVIIASLNMAGMHLLSNNWELQYIISKLIISLLVGFFVSFPLFRFWVYK